MSITTSFQVKGLVPLLAELEELQGKKLQSTVRASMGRGAQRIVRPRLAAVRGWKYGGHGGAYPTKGLLGDPRKVTARRVRTRGEEFAAISVKYRGWAGTVEAWVVKGTKPHVIRARKAGGTGVDSAARRINRGGATGAASLAFAGIFATVVNHPGAEPRDFIHDAAQGLEAPLLAAISDDLMKQVAKAKARRTG